MSKMNVKIQKLLSLALLLPLYGCGGGGGGGIAGLVGSLLSGGSSASSSSSGGAGNGSGLLASGSIPPIGGEGVATLTNPEPASMLLIGGGMVAMAYAKNRKK